MFISSWEPMRIMEREVGFAVRKVFSNGTALVISLPKDWIESEHYKLRKLEEGKILLEPVR